MAWSQCKSLYLLSLLELQFFEGETHGALAIVCTSTIFVLFNDQLLGQIQERVIDIRAILGARFDYRDAWVRLLKLLYLLVTHLNLRLVIHLVGEDHDFDLGARVFLNLIKPHGYAQEALPISQVEDDDNAVGALVVGICDSPVAFLSCRVPNLQLDRALVDLQGSEAEVDTDCADVVLLEAVILLSITHHTIVTHAHKIKKVSGSSKSRSAA